MLQSGAGHLRRLSEGESGGGVKGRLSVRDEKAPQLMCDSVYPLSQADAAAGEERPQEKREEAAGKTLYLKFPHKDHPSVRHMRLVFNMFPGTTQVKMVMADTRKIYGTQVLLRDALIQEARETLGEENVVVK